MNYNNIEFNTYAEVKAYQETLTPAQLKRINRKIEREQAKMPDNRYVEDGKIKSKANDGTIWVQYNLIDFKECGLERPLPNKKIEEKKGKRKSKPKPTPMFRKKDLLAYNGVSYVTNAFNYREFKKSIALADHGGIFIMPYEEWLAEGNIMFSADRRKTAFEPR